jgi:hypothetical protein
MFYSWRRSLRRNASGRPLGYLPFWSIAWLAHNVEEAKGVRAVGSLEPKRFRLVPDALRQIKSLGVVLDSRSVGRGPASWGASDRTSPKSGSALVAIAGGCRDGPPT